MKHRVESGDPVPFHKKIIGIRKLLRVALICLPKNYKCGAEKKWHIGPMHDACLGQKIVADISVASSFFKDVPISSTQSQIARFARIFLETK